MWTNISTTIKCPRGDCLHTKCPADEPPCSSCTCNRRSDSMCRHFAYQPKGANYDRDRAKPSVLGEPPKE